MTENTKPNTIDVNKVEMFFETYASCREELFDCLKMLYQSSMNIEGDVSTEVYNKCFEVYNNFLDIGVDIQSILAIINGKE